MREYSNRISLTKNARGIYSLDTSIGCSSGMQNEKGGCFGDCYAAKSAKIYGYDFSKTVYRYFENEKHRRKIVLQISKIPMGFVRIGTSGDPSEDWNHTIDVCSKIENYNKQIVIITKHWTLLSKEDLQYISKANICINTSVSALDKPHIIEKCIEQYNKLKQYCKSVLRIVTCDFNTDNEYGKEFSLIQQRLLLNDNLLETVLRLNKNSELIKNGIVNYSKSKFLGNNTIISKRKSSIYFGHCSKCHEMCGIGMKPVGYNYPQKKGVIEQLSLI